MSSKLNGANQQREVSSVGCICIVGQCRPIQYHTLKQEQSPLPLDLSAVVSATDNPSEWFKQEHIGPLGLRDGLALLRKPVFDISAAGLTLCHEFLYVERALLVLIFQPIPSL